MKMLRRSNPAEAFSLVETVLALGILAFSLMAILGLFPVGFRQATSVTAETHGAQIAREIFATLRMPPFEDVDCFGARLNLAVLNTDDAPVRLYAAFPVSGNPSIGPEAAGDTLYALELRFRRLDTAANEVTLSLAPIHRSEDRLLFQSIVAKF